MSNEGAGLDTAWWWRWRCCLAGRLPPGSALLPRLLSGCEAADSFQQNSRLVPAFQPEQAAPAPARHHLLISAAPSWRDAIADSTLVELWPAGDQHPSCVRRSWAGPVRRNSRRGGTSRPHIHQPAASPQLSVTSITRTFAGHLIICITLRHRNTVYRILVVMFPTCNVW